MPVKPEPKPQMRSGDAFCAGTLCPLYERGHCELGGEVRIADDGCLPYYDVQAATRRREENAMATTEVMDQRKQLYDRLVEHLEERLDDLMEQSDRTPEHDRAFAALAQTWHELAGPMSLWDAFGEKRADVHTVAGGIWDGKRDGPEEDD